MKELRVLVSVSKPPNYDDRAIRFFKNIYFQLKKNINIKIIWLVSNPQKIEEKNEDEIIIDFHNYKDANEIIKKYQPNIILIDGWIDFITTAIQHAAKKEKIIVIANYTLINSDYIQKNKGSQIIVKRLHVLFGKKVTIDANNKSGIKKSILFNWKKFRFLENTINFNSIFKKFNFLLYFLYCN